MKRILLLILVLVFVSCNEDKPAVKKTDYSKKSKDELGKEPVFQKLGKSLVAYCDIKKGEEITRAKLSGKIFKETYIPVRQAENLIGKIACNDIKKDEEVMNPNVL